MTARLGWVFAVLVSHWRRHPLQLGVMILGLSVATALWSGVQAINGQARQSYDQAARVLGGDRLAVVAPAGATQIALSDYVALRRAGWAVSPVLEGRWRSTGPGRVAILGIDAVTLPAEAEAVSLAAGGAGGAPQDFTQPPYEVRGHPDTLAEIEPIQAPTGPPRLTADPRIAPGRLIVDIALAAAMTGRTDAIDRLIVAPTQLPGLPGVAELTEGRLTLSPPSQTGDLERLTDSFHLNLTAFGFLSFVVGLFIVQGAIGLAFEQRRATIRTLRAFGAPLREIALAMLLELLAIALAAAAIGMALGYVMASALLPGVAATLRGLYGAGVGGTLSLSPLWWLLGLSMAGGGAVLAASASFWRLAGMPLLAPARAEAWRRVAAARTRAQARLAAVAVAVAVLAYGVGDGLAAGFAMIGGVLMGGALLLPGALGISLTWLARVPRGPLGAWLLADTRQQLGGLSLALMALLLALAVNIGVGTMVGSFRDTFLGWLDQRLGSELYVLAEDNAAADRLRDAIAADPAVTAILPNWKTDLEHRGWPLELFGFRDHETYRDAWPLIAAAPDVWDRVAAGEAALISEQMARRLDIWPGATLTLPSPGGPVAFAVAGVYSDYGNPAHQALVSLDALARDWSDIDRRRFGIRTDPAEAAALADRLRAAHGLEDALIEQAALKAFSRGVFENTFAVTLALNTLTFIVAGIAILTSLLTISAARLPQIAPLWAMGVTRARLARLEVVRAALLALVTAVLSIPLGLALAWVLTDVINVRAFGWQLPVKLFPGDWVWLTALAVLTAVAAAALPALALRRVSPTALLKVFADER